jgi:capsid protein
MSFSALALIAPPLPAPAPPAALSVGGYDAIEPKGRRRPPSGNNQSEDLVLSQRKRDLVTSQAKTLHRNYAVARFLVDRHLNYNTEFECYSSAGDGLDSWDDEFHAWLKEVIAKDRFDAGGRHSLPSYLRVKETRCVLDGDCGSLQIADGTLQAVESDVIRNPNRKTEGKWINGLKIGPANKTLAYSIRDRQGQGYGDSRIVPAQRFFLRAAFDRFDQFRGVSPFTSAHNSLLDCYEGSDYTLAKMKAESLFAMAIFRDSESSAAPFSESDATGTATQSTRKKYEVDFGRGPVLLDLEPGDDAKFLTSNSPGSGPREFMAFTIMIALKSLGMPYSFFDGSSTNFFGSRADWLHYERHCVPVRRANAEFLDWWLRWRIQIAVQDREIKLPRGLTLRRPWWEWVPAGMPWWQPEREIAGDRAAVESGFDTPQRICRARGRGDFFRNIDEIARANEYAKKKGVSLSYSPLPVTITLAENEEIVK